MYGLSETIARLYTEMFKISFSFIFLAQFSFGIHTHIPIVINLCCVIFLFFRLSIHFYLLPKENRIYMMLRTVAPAPIVSFEFYIAAYGLSLMVSTKWDT